MSVGSLKYAEKVKWTLSTGLSGIFPMAAVTVTVRSQVDRKGKYAKIVILRSFICM